MTGKIKFTIGGESHEAKIDSWQRSNVSPSIELTVERTMTTEDKALAMVREEDEKGYLNYDAALAALCRAIEQHEAFRQEVSDAVEQADLLDIYGKAGAYLILQRFIIPTPKPDPLLAAMNEVIKTADVVQANADQLRAALAARGLEIREKNDD